MDVNTKEFIDPAFEKYGTKYLKRLEKTVSNLWNGSTYRVIQFERNNNLKLSCGLGTYYSAIKSQDIFDFELLREFARIQPYPDAFGGFREKLTLRNKLHDMGDVFHKPVGMSSALSVDTAIIYADKKTYKICLWERSKNVAIYPGLLQLMPTGMFTPAVNDVHNEFSVRHNIYREYLEEVFGIKEADRSSGHLAYDYFYDNPNLKYLKQLEDSGAARLYFTGVSINLLQLRTGICGLLLIKDKDWIINHSTGKKIGDLQLSPINFNIEYTNTDNLNISRFGALDLDLGKNLELPKYFLPQYFVPPAAAALKLGIKVAREELGI